MLFSWSTNVFVNLVPGVVPCAYLTLNVFAGRLRGLTCGSLITNS